MPTNTAEYIHFLMNISLSLSFLTSLIIPYFLLYRIIFGISNDLILLSGAAFNGDNFLNFIKQCFFGDPMGAIDLSAIFKINKSGNGRNREHISERRGVIDINFYYYYIVAAFLGSFSYYGSKALTRHAPISRKFEDNHLIAGSKIIKKQKGVGV